METILYLVKKTDPNQLNSMIEDYKKRIQKYHRFDVLTIPDIKNRGKLTKSLQKQKEGELTLDRVKENDYLVLLDEAGRQMDSLLFSNFINARSKNKNKYSQ